MLNLKQIQVENYNENDDKKITKLAIGKPGGADFSNENWQQIIKLYCLCCDVEIEYSDNQKIKDLVTSIINSASANDQSNIAAWEEEILPCEHTLTLSQSENIKIPPKYDATCAECSLSSNLWLCLTCGNLGCGRKFWDGSGGNNHGIDHYEKTKHPIAVKTGTITPNGDACNIYLFSSILLLLQFRCERS